MKNNLLCKFLGMLSILFVFPMHSALALQCISQDNKPVDWWVIYKLPQGATPPPNTAIFSSQPNAAKAGYWYFYFDANGTLGFYPDGVRGLDKSDQALGYTLQQIYDADKSDATRNKTAWFIYNDSVPDADYRHAFCLNKNIEKGYSHYCGHSKGVLAVDDASGFWLVHSITYFPLATKDTNNKNRDYSYSSSPLNGQNALCMSFAGVTTIRSGGDNTFNKIGQQLKYINPEIYSRNLPYADDDIFPNLRDLIQQQNIITKPEHSSIELHTLAGKRFVNFAETNPYPNDNEEPFYNYLARSLRQNILEQSWPNSPPELPKICNWGRSTVNIINSFASANGYTWTNAIDHAKWAIGVEDGGDAVCLGDLNHDAGQLKRGGGLTCMYNYGHDPVSWKLHNFLASLVAEHTACDFDSGNGGVAEDFASSHALPIAAGVIVGSAALGGILYDLNR